jgi:hypothetical protein
MHGLDLDAYVRAAEFVAALDRSYPGNRDAGWLYIVRNQELRHHLLKIGMTRRGPLERAAELGASTSIPGTFETLYFVHVGDAREAERYVHDLLADVRYANNREFFATSVPRAVKALDAAAGAFPLLRSQRNKGNRNRRSKPIPQAFPADFLDCLGCGQRNRVQLIAIKVSYSCSKCGAPLG